MEDIRALINFNTDTFSSCGLQTPMEARVPFTEVLEKAISMSAKVVIKTSTGSWYIKVFGSKTNEYVKQHLIDNENNGYKPKSRAWLIYY